MFITEYDWQIKQSVKQWWPDYDEWLQWKAQLGQESELDPNAQSSVGAAGLAQFMPGTWLDVSRQLGYGQVSPHVSRYAIEAGAYYMAQLRRSWSSQRPIDDRQHLALASYNTGGGNMLAAQRACGGALHWEDIKPCLVKVTGKSAAKQTTDYVTFIDQWFNTLLNLVK